MREGIKNFAAQFGWQPKIINNGKLQPAERLIVCGMGGSRLSADILAALKPEKVRAVHLSYGLPELPATDFATALLVLSSYSGGTEEILESYDLARARGLNFAVMAVGGELLARAERDGVPCIQFPNTGIQPRLSIGFGVKALAAFLEDEKLLAELNSLEKILQPESLELRGSELARDLVGQLPLIYASEKNRALAQIWKIKINENSKIPAFANALPELNHNEMTGFDSAPGARMLSENMTAIFLADSSDHPQIQKRFAATEKLYRDRKIKTLRIDLGGATRAERLFNNLLLADWVSVVLGESYGAETEQVPMVEEFKALIK